MLKRSDEGKYELILPIADDDISMLRSGDSLMISGEIYTARDAAHKRMMETLDNLEPLPFDVNGKVIYYMGPSPARPGRVIGSAGPTTSSRMDKYAPRLLDKGLKVMMGKGRRSKEVIESIIENHAVYLAVIGGAGALISKCIKECEMIAYEDLGTEAIYRLRVENMPAIVVIDSLGNDKYDL